MTAGDESALGSLSFTKWIYSFRDEKSRVKRPRSNIFNNFYLSLVKAARHATWQGEKGLDCFAAVGVKLIQDSSALTVVVSKLIVIPCDEPRVSFTVCPIPGKGAGFMSAPRAAPSLGRCWTGLGTAGTDAGTHWFKPNQPLEDMSSGPLNLYFTTGVPARAYCCASWNAYSSL